MFYFCSRFRPQIFGADIFHGFSREFFERLFNQDVVQENGSVPYIYILYRRADVNFLVDSIKEKCNYENKSFECRMSFLL